MRKRYYSTPAKKLTELECLQLSGPVKQLMETRYKVQVKDGQISPGKIDAESYSKETNYIITFTKEAGLLHEVFYGATDKQVNYYDEKGQRIKQETYYNNKLNSTGLTIYNQEGKVTETINNDANGDISHRTVYTLNELGQALESVTYWGKDQAVFNRTVYTLDETVRETNGIKHRLVLSAVHYLKDGSVDYTSTNKYNKEGKNLESKMIYTPEEKQKYNSHCVFQYNEHGDCIQMTYYNNDGSVKQAHNFTHQYDSNGQKIIEPREPHNPFALEPGVTEQTEKDHHGNWVKKTVYFENKPISIIVRRLSYYGEPSEKEPEFVHPLTTEAPIAIADNSHTIEPFEPQDARWLAEGAPNAESFSLHRYYVLKYNELPSVVNFSGAYIEAYAVLKELQEHCGGQIIQSVGNVHNGWSERFIRYTLDFKHHRGYVLQAYNINHYDEEEYTVNPKIRKHLYNPDSLYFGTFTLLKPSESSANSDEYFEQLISDYIDDCTVRRKPEKPFINIIEATANGFVMVEHPVDDDFEIRDLNINYGYGFEQFHNDLMQRFNKSTKGLVLFHGEPGTGKTYYIRHLLRKMVASRKVVIYMPPNMVDHLTEPGFMTFLTREVRNFSADGNFCVLLIEDAEPLLAKRQEGIRIQGVTNLLNLSDGLLNDMLNLQIICTFNVDLKKLDSALLRPGRLIARKEFKPLGELDANLLAQRLGIKHHFTAPVTLSEIYAMRKNQGTIIHDVEPDKDASTLLDDF